MPATLLASPGPTRVASPSKVRYITLPDGSTYVPVGPNLCFPRHLDPSAEEDGLARYRGWFDRLAAHGGDFARLWLGHGFFDLEPDRCGEFSEKRAARLRAVLDLAAARGVRLKLTLEHFRSIDPRPVAEIFPGAARFDRPLLHRARGGVADDIAGYLASAAGRAHFLAKLDWLAARFARHPAVFAWELWNEMNAVHAGDWLAWTAAMLPELRRRFPGTLALQSLGSHDRPAADADYRRLAVLPDAAPAQIHRYLDLHPDAFPACRGPVDFMAASAVRELRALAPGRPVLLAESGAVEPAHSAPFALYARDTEGTILHDVLFAAFFAGAAGPGQIWHWDLYLARHELWWHYRAFRAALGGLDPAAEGFATFLHETPGLRAYELRGRSVRLFWLRDANHDWRAELVEGRPPPVRASDVLVLPDLPAGGTWETFDPWTPNAAWRPAPSADVAGAPRLPAWRRSLLLRRTS